MNFSNFLLYNCHIKGASSILLASKLLSLTISNFSLISSKLSYTKSYYLITSNTAQSINQISVIDTTLINYGLFNLKLNLLDKKTNNNNQILNKIIDIYDIQMQAIKFESNDILYYLLSIENIINPDYSYLNVII